MKTDEKKTIVIEAPIPAGTVFNINNVFDDGTMNIFGNGSGKATAAIAETEEARGKRLDKVLNVVAKRLNKFDDTMLWRDTEGHQMKSENLVVLFRKCFGLNTHPGVENGQKEITANLCTMLLEKRKGCGELNNDGYVLHTVMNVLGYFTAKGVIVASDMKIAILMVGFDKKHTIHVEDKTFLESMARNVGRGRNGIFDEKTMKWFDYQIDGMKQKLKNKKG